MRAAGRPVILSAAIAFTLSSPSVSANSPLTLLISAKFSTLVIKVSEIKDLPSSAATFELRAASKPTTLEIAILLILLPVNLN